MTGYKWTDAGTSEGRARLKELLEAYTVVFARMDAYTGFDQSVMLFVNGAKNERVEIQKFGNQHERIRMVELLAMDDLLFLDPRQSVEPRPLEWVKKPPYGFDYTGNLSTGGEADHHMFATDQAGFIDFGFEAGYDGDWKVLVFSNHMYSRLRIADGKKENGSIEDSKAAIHQWRVNNLKSMIQ